MSNWEDELDFDDFDFRTLLKGPFSRTLGPPAEDPPIIAGASSISLRKSSVSPFRKTSDSFTDGGHQRTEKSDLSLDALEQPQARRSKFENDLQAPIKRQRLERHGLSVNYSENCKERRTKFLSDFNGDDCLQDFEVQRDSSRNILDEKSTDMKFDNSGEAYNGQRGMLNQKIIASPCYTSQTACNAASRNDLQDTIDWNTFDDGKAIEYSHPDVRSIASKGIEEGSQRSYFAGCDDVDSARRISHPETRVEDVPMPLETELCHSKNLAENSASTFKDGIDVNLEDRIPTLGEILRSSACVYQELLEISGDLEKADRPVLDLEEQIDLDFISNAYNPNGRFKGNSKDFVEGEREPAPWDQHVQGWKPPSSSRNFISSLAASSTNHGRNESVLPHSQVGRIEEITAKSTHFLSKSDRPLSLANRNLLERLKRQPVSSTPTNVPAQNGVNREAISIFDLTIEDGSENEASIEPSTQRNLSLTNALHRTVGNARNNQGKLFKMAEPTRATAGNPVRRHLQTASDLRRTEPEHHDQNPVTEKGHQADLLAKAGIRGNSIGEAGEPHSALRDSMLDLEQETNERSSSYETQELQLSGNRFEGNFLINHQKQPLSKGKKPVHIEASEPVPFSSHETNYDKEQSPPLNQLTYTIPGPAGAVQKCLGQRIQQSDPEFNANFDNADYLRKASRLRADSTDDTDFKSGAWMTALNFLGIENITSVQYSKQISTISSIKRSPNQSRIPKLLAVVKTCTPNGFGDAFVTLKDPTGVVSGTVYRKVLAETEFGRDIAPGAVLILNKVAVFRPSLRAEYLNITVNNVLQVFKKETIAPTRTWRYS
ncbi:hypothetical protein O6H91_13G009500 [Diphasiastrum complanatum]|uniref:Uncharacterized protein n=1 Tax=Diphasiastrum complanatum TaxID=34168 RepID=A0ACC2BSB1_DIPCM|nr:hypothetical protein O6H91_13G009500 [Diphasiastrum complanatum]